MDRVALSEQENYAFGSKDDFGADEVDHERLASINWFSTAGKVHCTPDKFRLSTIDTELLAEQTSFSDELVYAAARSALQGPVDGAAQVIDAAFGTKTGEALEFLPPLEEREFLSSNWTAQQIGAAIGMSVPFLLLHKGVSKCSGRLLGPASTVTSSHSARSTAEAMVTAGLYDGLLRETAQSRLSTEGLASNRIKQAVLGSSTMFALTRSSAMVSSLSIRGNNIGSKIFSNEIASCTLSGLPAGAFHAELESRLYRGTGATQEDLVSSMISFSLLGGGFSAGKSILGAKSRASEDYFEHTKNSPRETAFGVTGEPPSVGSLGTTKPLSAICKVRQSPEQPPAVSEGINTYPATLQSVQRIPDLRSDGMRKNHEVPREEVLDKIVELEVMFGIKIAPPDQSMRNPWKFWQGRPLAIADKLVTRVPEWSEVIGLEAGLYRSAPSIENGLTYHFFEPPKVPGIAKDNISGGLYERRQIFFQPNTSRLRALPEPEMKGAAPGITMQALSTHENAHHGQFRYGLIDSKLLDPLALRLGWEKSVQNGMQTWLIKSADGHQYRFDKVNRHWIQVLDDTASASPAVFSSKDIQRLAKVRPITDYFDEPIEMITEGTTFFRLGREHRDYLCRKSPELYSVVKELDQLEISKLLRRKNQTFIRDLEGRIVPETTEVTAQIQALESQLPNRTSLVAH